MNTSVSSTWNKYNIEWQSTLKKRWLPLFEKKIAEACDEFMMLSLKYPLVNN